MNEHDRYREMISCLLDGELPAEDSDALALHLETCPQCAAIYAAFSALSKGLGDDLEEPPEALHENVMAQIRREELRKKNRIRNRRIASVGVAAVLALVVAAAPRIFTPHGMALRASAPGSSSAASTVEAPAAMYDMEAEEAAMGADAAYDNGARSAAPDASFYDLSGRMSAEELAAAVGSRGQVAEPVPGDLLCSVLCSDNQMLFYRSGDELFYVLPGEGAYRADCDVQSLTELLQNG